MVQKTKQVLHFVKYFVTYVEGVNDKARKYISIYLSKFFKFRWKYLNVRQLFIIMQK